MILQTRMQQTLMERMNDLSQNKEEIIQHLRSDSEYYGDYGKKFLSNSDIYTLLNNPEQWGQKKESTVPMVIGGYFHTLICEPDKVDSYKIVDATSRNTKLYKELSEGEICLLQKEADNIELMREKLLSNEIIKGLIQEGNIEYETPSICKLHGEWWKGKADIINHDEKLIIDLKTTGDITKFKYSARKFNYDSQAYIYQESFGYEMIFVTIDKTTLQLGIYDCSNNFLERGKEKVIEAITQVRLIRDQDFNMDQYTRQETL